MSNVFLIDQGVSSNTLTVNADSTFTGSFTLDGYSIDPTNATMGQVLAYDGYSYKPSTLSSGLTGNFTNNQVLFGNVTNTSVQGSSNLTFDGYTLGVNHIIGTGTAPTGSIGNAISSGSVSITGSDTAGVISVTISSWVANPPNKTFFDVNFNSSYTTKPYVVIWPMNLPALYLMASSNGLFGNTPNGSTLIGWYMDDANVSMTGFSVKFGSAGTGGGPPPTSTCLFYYHVIG